MSEAKFTKGPWKQGEVARHIIYAAGGVKLATVSNSMLPESWANARLIAAAPELYEACREALDVILENCSSSELVGHDRYDRLRAVLAKVEGRDA